MRKLAGAAALIAAVAAGAFAPVSAVSVAAETSSVRMRITLGYLPSNAFLAAFVAKDEGLFAKRGLDVSFDMLPGGAMLHRALAAGTVQAGTLTAPMLVTQYESGADLQAVAAASVQSGANPTAGIVAAVHSNIRAAADFRGRTVGVPGLNGVNHLAFMQWLQDHHVDPHEVHFAAALLPQTGALLAAGAIDAALPVEPFLTDILRSGTGVLVARLPADPGDSYLATLYAMKRSWVKSNPAAVGAFRDGLRESVRWIAANPAAARKIQMRYLKVSEAAAMSAPLPEFVTDLGVAEIQYWIELCRRFGATRGDLPAADILAN